MSKAIADARSSDNVVEVTKKYKKRSQLRGIWIRLKRNKAAILGLMMFLVLVSAAVFADSIADYETRVKQIDYMRRLEKPSAEHIFGLDEYGRDIFARIIHGSRLSLQVGIIAVGVALFVGGSFGAIAGFYGGLIENIIMRSMDILLALPSILLAITLMAALGTSNFNLMLAIGLSAVPNYARIVRSAVLSVKDQEFIEAARAVGERNYLIVLSEVLPNCMAPIIVQVTLNVATAILSTSSLSFIGLGIQAPTPEWGNMLAGGRAFLRDAPHLSVFPGIAIAIAILSLNLFGDGLRDALDPKLKH